MSSLSPLEQFQAYSAIPELDDFTAKSLFSLETGEERVDYQKPIDKTIEFLSAQALHRGAFEGTFSLNPESIEEKITLIKAIVLSSTKTEASLIKKIDSLRDVTFAIENPKILNRLQDYITILFDETVPISERHFRCRQLGRATVSISLPPLEPSVELVMSSSVTPAFFEESLSAHLDRLFVFDPTHDLTEKDFYHQASKIFHFLNIAILKQKKEPSTLAPLFEGDPSALKRVESVKQSIPKILQTLYIRSQTASKSEIGYIESIAQEIVELSKNLAYSQPYAYLIEKMERYLTIVCSQELTFENKKTLIDEFSRGYELNRVLCFSQSKAQELLSILESKYKSTP